MGWSERRTLPVRVLRWIKAAIAFMDLHATIEMEAGGFLS
jgi:hypothetical protein